MINPKWLELPMSRTIFYGPKVVRAIEVRLYYANFLVLFRVIVKEPLWYLRTANV